MVEVLDFNQVFENKELLDFFWNTGAKYKENIHVIFNEANLD